jgi:hypothetical protein
VLSNLQPRPVYTWWSHEFLSSNRPRHDIEFYPTDHALPTTERLHVQRRSCAMKPVIIHPHPDLDAATCCALAGARAEEVHFLPAGATSIPDVCPCCGAPLGPDARVLDHPLGEKGRLDPDGTRHAAAIGMPEAAHADPQLLAEVEEQDSTGKVRQPRFSLARVLTAVRTDAAGRGLRDAALDREVVGVMSRVIRGLNLMHTARLQAQGQVATARIEQVGNVRIAVLPDGPMQPAAGIVLNEDHDVSASIYRTGHNLGINRYPGRTSPDLRLLGPHLPGWFVHSAGFLACWGSLKSPASSPPPADTPQDQEQLLALVRRVFESTKA